MHIVSICFFFFNDMAPTEIYTLSLHDALPIYRRQIDRPLLRWSVGLRVDGRQHRVAVRRLRRPAVQHGQPHRSEEHTSELQSRQYLVCRLLLEKKKKKSSNKVRDNTNKLTKQN